MTIIVNDTPRDDLENSYISVVDMATYVTDQVPDASVQTAWSALSEAQQALFLTRATKTLDGLVEWNGDRTSALQPLGWPRYNVWVDGRWIDSNITPIPVKEATAEMALWMMTGDGATSATGSDQSIYKEIEVGPLRIDFNNSSHVAVGAAKTFFPDIVAILLKGYGVISNPNLPGSGQAKNVRLQRA